MKRFRAVIKFANGSVNSRFITEAQHSAITGKCAREFIMARNIVVEDARDSFAAKGFNDLGNATVVTSKEV